MAISINDYYNDNRELISYTQDMINYVIENLLDASYLGCISYSDEGSNSAQPIWIWEKCRMVNTEIEVILKSVKKSEYDSSIKTIYRIFSNSYKTIHITVESEDNVTENILDVKDFRPFFSSIHYILERRILKSFVNILIGDRMCPYGMICHLYIETTATDNCIEINKRKKSISRLTPLNKYNTILRSNK